MSSRPYGDWAFDMYSRICPAVQATLSCKQHPYVLRQLQMTQLIPMLFLRRKRSILPGNMPANPKNNKPKPHELWVVHLSQT